MAELVKPTLKVQSGWTNAFKGEKLTLKCELEGEEDKWTYIWYKNEDEISTEKQSEYTFDVEDAATFTCKGTWTVGHPQSTEISNSITLTVSDLYYTLQPEAMNDRQGAFAAKNKRLCLQSRGQDGLKNSKGQTVPRHQRIHGHFQDSADTRRMWQGIQAITNYKTTPPACDRDASLLDALNNFEVQNNVVARKTIPPPSDQVLCLTTAKVRKTLCRVNPRKSAGPDNIPGRVLRECAEQLADVFTDIFNISLSSTTVPTCLKATTIIPVPKRSFVSCLNDYRPVALTPIMMCFERLIMRHIKTQLPPALDPMQFAYLPNRSTDDAISTTLHLALTHLDKKDFYVRMLFIDFSSAFNTIISQHLIEKLSLLGLNTSLCNWILDFLSGRPQSVRIGNIISSTTTLSTGAPQGCVLCPLLFTLLTHDCAPTHSSNHIIKFADDTTVVGLISKNDESAYREEVQRLTARCGANNLSLNVDKTKEMVVDFRRTPSDHR
ncbi:hypothetical protein C0J50_4441 [Silurus asotus]|uniref:Reverse transcriptase domain-containing protein n=1 Tax=Silurus asotus TaxID=30991 RepID=A0AAD5A9R8_SILAS|nr:hypothetical protein C0J50_4441 [Silurus asotus]